MAYVWRDRRWIDKRTGEPMKLPERAEVCAPQVMSDIPEYISPVTELPITSRSQRREDLKRHNCIEVDPPRKPRGFKNPRFAAKYGLPLNEE